MTNIATIPAIIPTLTAIDIAALRKADRVAFHHHEGRSYIVAVKAHKASDSDPFARDIDYRIEVPTTHFRDYSKGHRYGQEYKCFAWVSSAQYDDEWQTTAFLLRSGDEIALRWMRSGWNTERMNECSPHFHADTLCLEVRRGERTLVFHVETSICEDNSARMIRLA